MFEIYTDGGSRGNGGPGALGAWAWLIVSNDQEVACAYDSNPKLITNNQNELYALVNALIAIPDCSGTIHVKSDSAYLLNGMIKKWYEGWIKNGWRNAKKKPVENKDIWEMLVRETKRLEAAGVTFVYTKVKGHSGNRWNEKADELVNIAMDKKLIGTGGF